MSSKNDRSHGRCISLALAAVLSCFLVGCASLHSCTLERPEEAPARSVPLRLMHRGQFYDVNNLMDASYRERSDDPFVQGFDPDRAVAIEWAGLDVHGQSHLLD